MERVRGGKNLPADRVAVVVRVNSIRRKEASGKNSRKGSKEAHVAAGGQSGAEDKRSSEGKIQTEEFWSWDNEGDLAGARDGDQGVSSSSHTSAGLRLARPRCV